MSIVAAKVLAGVLKPITDEDGMCAAAHFNDLRYRLFIDNIPIVSLYHRTATLDPLVRFIDAA